MLSVSVWDLASMLRLFLRATHRDCLGRYGGEGSQSVGTAFNAQIATGLRKGLGFLGAGKQYTVLTPSMTHSFDLKTISDLIEEEHLAVVTDKLYSMYDVVDGHERLETHRTVGKCVLQVISLLFRLLLYVSTSSVVLHVAQP